MHFSRKLTTLSAVAIAASMSITGVTAAQEDGTSGLPPDAILSCQIVPSQWDGQASASPEASPVVTAAVTPIASPSASPVDLTGATPVTDQSTPVASPVVEETEEADETVDPLTADLIDASGSILDCMSENNLEVLTDVTGPEFRGTWLGFGGNVSDADLGTILPLMPRLPYQLVGIENATADGSTATATVNYTVGNQLLSSDWTFALTDVNGNDVWVVESETLKSAVAPEAAVAVDLSIADGSYTLSSTTISGTDAVINVTNTADAPHEVLIMQIPEGTNTEAIVSAPNGIPEGGTFIAQATISAGATGQVILIDLAPGTYTVVDLLPDANGTPNVSNGMITTFEVTAP